jgi:hypothetical protein
LKGEAHLALDGSVVKQMSKEVKHTGDSLNVLLAMYNEQCTQARHYESQRSTVSGFLVAISAAMIGLITYDQHITRSDLPAAIFLFVLGVFGMVSSVRHYERSLRHGKRAQEYRKKLNALIQDAEILKLREDADRETKSRFSKFYYLPYVRLHHIWHVLHLAIALLGFMLIAMSAREWNK